MFKSKLEKSGLRHVYQWYSNAMCKRRPGSQLSYENFVSHFVYNFNEYDMFIFGNYKLGFILGHKANGYYVPSHFAPRTMRGGIKLLELFAKQNVILAITEDLSKTLEKMSCYHFTDIIIPSYFRGNLTFKYIWVSCPIGAIGLRNLFNSLILQDTGLYYHDSIFNLSWDDIIDNATTFSNYENFTYPYMDFEFFNKPTFNVTNVYI